LRTAPPHFSSTDSLPNGFHEAFLESVDVDYKSRRGLIKLRLCVGDPDAATQKEREAYKGADLSLVDLVYFVIEGPDPRSKYAETKGLWIDGGRPNVIRLQRCLFQSSFYLVMLLHTGFS
jgi:hypothetical protein